MSEGKKYVSLLPVSLASCKLNLAVWYFLDPNMLSDADRAHARYASAAFSLDAVRSRTVGLRKAWNR